MLIGAFFTLAGLVTLMTPSIPFICIGALIFGPIELLIGLFSERERPTKPLSREQSALLRFRPNECPSCGMRIEGGRIDGAMNWCPNCGTQLR